MSTDYQKLSQAYHAANVNKKKHILQEETNVLWREIKKGEKQFDVWCSFDTLLEDNEDLDLDQGDILEFDQS